MLRLEVNRTGVTGMYLSEEASMYISKAVSSMTYVFKGGSPILLFSFSCRQTQLLKSGQGKQTWQDGRAYEGNFKQGRLAVRRA